MNKKHASILIASLLIGSSFAHAGAPGNHTWYVLPQTGLLSTDSDLEAAKGVFGAVKLGKAISDNWDIQFGLSYGQANEESSSFQNGTYKQTNLSAEALYLMSRSSIRPFLSFGIGATQDKVNYTGVSNLDASKTSLSGSAGAGFQYAWKQNAFLQFDIKYVLSKPDYSNGGSIEVSQIGNVYTGLGLGFHFGDVPQPTPKAAPAPVVVAPAAPKTCEELGNCKKVEAPKVEIAPVVEAKPVPPAPVKYEVVENNLRADGAFATGSGKLTKQGQAQIDAAIAAAGTSYATLTKTEGLELEVIGHADRTGKADVNQKLSEQRAEAVKAYLVSKGLSADAIKTAGRGSSQPVTKPEDCKNLKGKKLSSCLSVDRRIELHGKATRVVKAQ